MENITERNIEKRVKQINMSSNMVLAFLNLLLLCTMVYCIMSYFSYVVECKTILIFFVSSVVLCIFNTFVHSLLSCYNAGRHFETLFTSDYLKLSFFFYLIGIGIGTYLIFFSNDINCVNKHIDKGMPILSTLFYIMYWFFIISVIMISFIQFTKKYIKYQINRLEIIANRNRQPPTRV